LLHECCRPEWRRAREIEAKAALAAFGILPPWHGSPEAGRNSSTSSQQAMNTPMGLVDRKRQSTHTKLALILAWIRP
jgi:hypothetical protein